MSTNSIYPKKDWEKHAEKYFFTKERISTIDQKKKMMMSMKQKYQNQQRRLKDYHLMQKVAYNDENYFAQYSNGH